MYNDSAGGRIRWRVPRGLRPTRGASSTSCGSWTCRRSTAHARLPKVSSRLTGRPDPGMRFRLERSADGPVLTFTTHSSQPVSAVLDEVRRVR